MPSVWPEIRPVVVLEAQSARVPVVGSDIGGIPRAWSRPRSRACSCRRATWTRYRRPWRAWPTIASCFTASSGRRPACEASTKTWKSSSTPSSTCSHGTGREPAAGGLAAGARGRRPTVSSSGWYILPGELARHHDDDPRRAGALGACARRRLGAGGPVRRGRGLSASAAPPRARHWLSAVPRSLLDGFDPAGSPRRCRRTAAVTRHGHRRLLPRVVVPAPRGRAPQADRGARSRRLPRSARRHGPGNRAAAARPHVVEAAAVHAGAPRRRTTMRPSSRRTKRAGSPRSVSTRTVSPSCPTRRRRRSAGRRAS